MSTAIVSDVTGGKFNLLKWDRQETRYYPLTFDLYNKGEIDESYNLVTNDTDVKEEIAATLYFKDIGTRKGLSVAESNVEYEAQTDTVKNVYTNKAITDIRKLVTEGYIKIERQSLDVEIATEKATL